MDYAPIELEKALKLLSKGISVYYPIYIKIKEG